MVNWRKMSQERTTARWSLTWSYVLARWTTWARIKLSFERVTRHRGESSPYMSLYSVFIAARTSAGRLPVVFERLEGEVNSVVTEMALEGRSGEYSSWLLSRGGGLGVRASVLDTDIGSLLLATRGNRDCIPRPDTSETDVFHFSAQIILFSYSKLSRCILRHRFRPTPCKVQKIWWSVECVTMQKILHVEKCLKFGVVIPADFPQIKEN